MQSDRRILGVPLRGWALAFGALSALVLVSTSRMVFGAREGTIGLVDALGSAALDWFLWAPLLPAVLFLARRFPLAGEGSLVRALAVHLPAGIVASCIQVLLYAVASAAIREWRFETGSLSSELRSGFLFKFHTGVLVYWTVLVVHLAFDLGRRSRAESLRRAELAHRLTEARLQLLQQQLAPHFLFNTLNAIAATVRGDPDAAEDMLVRLGDLLRRTLSHRGDALIPLSEELAFLDDYLELQKRRFGERLRVEIDVDPEALGARVPSFLLQPLAENAIRHGVAVEPGPGTLRLSATRADSRLQLGVEDDGPGVGSAPSGGLGLGLANTRERLALLFRDEQELRVEARTPRGTTVRIELPYRTLGREPA